MTRIALIATFALVAACGGTADEAAPATDTTTVAPAVVDTTVAPDTTKVDSAAVVDTTKQG
jgi:hypothetical protein